jgi:outer membrane autotransporter protein
VGYLCGGGLFQFRKNYSFNPYISADYIYLHQKGFKEKGAPGLNLHVNSGNSSVFRGEAGFHLNGCFKNSWGKWIPDLKFGCVREWRFKGKYYHVELIDAAASFAVEGLNPDRTLFSPGISLMGLFFQEAMSFSISYDSEFGKHFRDQSVNVQLGYSF